MPRTSRRVVPDSLHHIWFRGNNRRRLFSYPKDYAFFMRQLARASRVHDVALHAWCLLPNHGHLAARPAEAAGLSAMMKRVCQRYAQYRNRSYGGSGKVFEERFGSRPVFDLGGEGVVLAYVENNAPLAGLCPSPEAHRWCSYRLKVDPSFPDPYRPAWTPSAFWTSLGPEPASKYQTWVAAWRERAEARRLEEGSTPARRPDRSRAS